MIFFAPGTMVDPPLAPTVRGLCRPPATRSDHWYEGVGAGYAALRLHEVTTGTRV